MRRNAWLAGIAAGCIAASAGAAGTNPRKDARSAAYVVPPRVTDRAALSEWLLRLADGYRVDGAGTIYIQPVDPMRKRPSPGEEEENSAQQETEYIPPMVFPLQGTGDCVSIGTGAGIHCILNIGWQDQFEVNMDPDAGTIGVWNLPGGVSYLNPSMLLVGLEPARQGLQLLLVDNKGLPEGASASVAGDRATMRVPCVNAPALFLAMNPEKSYERRSPATCERITRIDARRDGKVVLVAIDIEINTQLVTQLQMTLRREKKKDRR
ncbi:MAG: hypothetical protein M3Y79_03645 [Pseudomonadota bacterium]|nr:hypothetical protein [Pseudomonadota bacterium]